MKTIKIAMILFVTAILSGCSEDKVEDDFEVVYELDYIHLKFLNSSWVSCAWEELVEYVDADGKKVKIINRFSSMPADEESISILVLPSHINVCNLYLNDNKIEDFLLLCPDERSPYTEFKIPLEIKLLHTPSGRETVIYSFDKWDNAGYIEYRIVRMHPSSDDLTETYYKESAGKYINMIDGYPISFKYMGWGYINDLGYERCGLIGDLTGPYPRVHIIPSDAPRNAKYTLLGLKQILEYKDEINYYSVYLNPDYQNLIDGAEYVVAPDDEWPDMSDISYQ